MSRPKNIRVYWNRLGSNVHLRIFIRGLAAGSLCISHHDWLFFQKALNAEFVEEVARHE